MAEENQNISHGYQPAEPAPTPTATHEEKPEIKDRGMFDFLGKKKEEEEKVPTAAHQNVVIASELEQVHVSDDQHCEQPEKKVGVHQVDKEDEKKHHTSLLDKLRGSDSSSSSSSDEEVEENGEKIRRKKKKGLKNKAHEHITGDTKVEEPEKKIDYYKEDDTAVPVEKCDDVVVTHEGVVPHPEEKKGFIEKIKEKFPGAQKKEEEDHVTHPVAPVPTAHPVECTTSPTDAAAAHHHDGEEAEKKKGFLEKIKEKLPGYHKTEDHEEKKDTPTHY